MPLIFRFASTSLPVLVLAALPSCSSTSVTARGDDVLIVEHRGATEALASTWTLEGAWKGGAVAADDLKSVSVDGLVGTNFGAETIDPHRDLQGVVDRSEPGRVLISIRQRGRARWANLPINGIYPVAESGVVPVEKKKLVVNESESAPAVAQEPELVAAELSDSDKGGFGFGWVNPMNWFGGGNDEPKAAAPAAAEVNSPAPVQAAVAPAPSSAPEQQKVTSEAASVEKTEAQRRWEVAQAASRGQQTPEPLAEAEESKDTGLWSRIFWPW